MAQFLRGHQRNFERCFSECPDLEAHWDAVSEHWRFVMPYGTEPTVNVRLGVISAADGAAASLPGIGVTFDADRWEAFFNAMRICSASGFKREWMFESTRSDRVNLLDWSLMQDGRSLADV